jgi:hypothetical protein
VPESLGEEFELVGVEVEVEVASQYEDTYVVWYEDRCIVVLVVHTWLVLRFRCVSEDMPPNSCGSDESSLHSRLSRFSPCSSFILGDRSLSLLCDTRSSVSDVILQMCSPIVSKLFSTRFRIWRSHSRSESVSMRTDIY